MNVLKTILEKCREENPNIYANNIYKCIEIKNKSTSLDCSDFYCNEITLTEKDLNECWLDVYDNVYYIDHVLDNVVYIIRR
jgi:hypothetical protein